MGIGERRMEKKMRTAIPLAALCFLVNQIAAFQNVTTLRFEEGYIPLFGERNILRSDDHRSVRLLLDHHTGAKFDLNKFIVIVGGDHNKSPFWNSGSGFISSDLYNHGFFSAKIKLPSEYTAGVVVAFYVSIVVSLTVFPELICA